MSILGKPNKRVVLMVLMAALFFAAISSITTVNATTEVGYLSIEVTVTNNSASIKVIGDNITDVADADVYIDDAYLDTTDAYGYVNESDFSPGNHHVYAAYGELSADSYFRIGGSAIFLNVSVNNASVSINVIDNGSTPVANADVYIDSEYIGASNAYGFVNATTSVKPGQHYAYAQYGDLAAEKDFRIGGNAITVNALVNGQNVSILVNDENGDAVYDADLYIDGEYAGTTNAYGFVNDSVGAKPGIHYAYAQYGDLAAEKDFRIGGNAITVNALVNGQNVSILVNDENGDAVYDADLYIDGEYAGTTNAYGFVNDSVGAKPGIHYAYAQYG
ncbi:MAG: hypothetical protein WC974_05845, partial [Thermoplasmata archaeon]